jgi:hypothetical protein
VAQIGGGIHVEKKFAALRVLSRLPGKFLVGRIDDARPPLLPRLTGAQNLAALPKNSRIRAESIAAIGNRQRILRARVDGVLRRARLQSDHTVAGIHSLKIGLPVGRARRRPWFGRRLAEERGRR